jgi:DNA polymerase-3 subunit chi
MNGPHLYFIETKAVEQRQLLCRLVYFLYEEGRRVQVVTDSTLAAQHLDQMIWSFSQESFIPHRILTPNTADSIIEPVIITVGEKELKDWEILIGDGDMSLQFMKHYPIGFHFIIKDDEERIQASRLLWQAAKGEGFQLHHISYFPMARAFSVFEQMDINH